MSQDKGYLTTTYDSAKVIIREDLERVLDTYCQQCGRDNDLICRYCRLDPDRKVVWERKGEQR